MSSRKFDKKILSAYIDGELDDASMDEAEAMIRKDRNARQYVLDTVRVTARMRSAMRMTVDDRIPDRLLTAACPPGGRSRRGQSRPLHPLFRIAAMLLLVFLGFSAGGLIFRGGTDAPPVLLSDLPDRYQLVVDEALEHNLSGTNRMWQDPDTPETVRVTPTSTYRDSSGRFYREYRLEITANARHRQVTGLASRVAAGKWQTRALFF